MEILFVLMAVVALLIIFLVWRKDRMYLKKPTRDALSPALKKEIEEERAQFYKRREMFEKALTRSQKKK